MIEKPRIKYPIVVEGRYDRQRILDIFEADCISTDGFGIFNSKETNATIKALAKRSKLIVLTDSDHAGSMIRNRISQSIGKDSMIDLYTPQIKGKEKRKKTPSKQGYLGVEGMTADVIRDLLTPFVCGSEDILHDRVTKMDLYSDGFFGRENSTERRDALAEKFSLPKGMNAKALTTALYYVTDKDGYDRAVAELSKSKVDPV